jgi:N-acetylmuramoyl-L-alanine amidase
MIKKKSALLFLLGIYFPAASFTGPYPSTSFTRPYLAASFTGPLSESSLKIPLRSNPPLRRATGLHTIVLDPGHGGIDPGTTNGLISKEKNVTLAIALKLGEAIKKGMPGVKVVYTRTTDILPGHASTKDDGIHNRALIANQAKGDLFISIHCDATPTPAGGYYEKRITGYKKRAVYVGKGQQRTKKIMNIPIYQSYWVKNTVVGATTYIWKAEKSGKKGSAIGMNPEDLEDSTIEWDMESPEGRMRADLYEKKFFANSATLASLVEDEFRRSGRKTWGVKQRGVGIGVLEATGMPSVLIETGYLSNKEEEKYLNSTKGQTQVARNIVTALKRYNQRLENE